MKLMMLDRPKISYSKEAIVALIVGVWLSIFLVFIAPFDASELSLRIRILLLPAYGVLASVAYLIMIPLQNWIRKESNKWNTTYEIAFLFVYTLICLAFSYLYYKSSIINGTYAFSDFLFGQFYPICLVLLPVLILSRWFMYKQSTRAIHSTIILKGENKLDVLKLDLSNLISINSANNYVEVNYLEDMKLKKKLLRTTLTKIHHDVPGLIKVHRSYLINPSHFKEWKDSSTIHISKMEIPVSKKYRNDILSLDHSPLKP